MITKAQLEKMTPLELEKALNDAVKDIEYTSTDRSDVRRRMHEAIEKLFKFEIWNSTTDYANASLGSKRYGIGLKLSTKATGEIVPITRLRNAHVVGVGKIKIDGIGSSYGTPCFEFDDEKTLKLKRHGSTSGGNVSFKMKDCKNMTFKEMSNPEFFLTKVFEQNDPEEKFRDELLTRVAQPLIQRVAFGASRGLPRKFKRMSKKDDGWFETCKQEILTANPGIINDIIDDIANGRPAW